MKQVLSIVIFLAGALQVFGGPLPDRLVLLNVQQSPNAWSDSRLYQRLQTVLTREPGWRVEGVRTLQAEPGAPGELPGVDSLIALGRDLGGQVLISIVISDQRLERSKSFQVPLVFHKWEVIGTIKGELRIIDLVRGKQVKAESFETEQHGPRIFQATMDDTKFDPDITMTASEKAQFFANLEEKLVMELRPKIIPVIAKGEREQLARQDTRKRP